MALEDYVTVAEFRAWALDGAAEFTDPEVNEAQDEVVDRLEAWARTSWKSRTATEKFDVGQRGYVLSNVPVSAVSSVIFDGDVVGVTDYVTDLPGGILWFDTSAYLRDTLAEHDGITVAYTYGFNAVPRAVKRPVMAAMATLLPHVAAQKAGKIPDNVTEYRTEGATFVIEPGDGEEPWPWDAIASRDIRSYWGPRRPLAVGSI